jgi:sua5/yciO/yrdC/ywlC family protein
MSHHLFNALRSLDHTDATIILAQASGKEGAGLAYMNRLEKASSFTKTER